MNSSPMTTTSPRTYARVAGVLYLIIIASGIFAEFVIRASLRVSGDVTTTVNNIIASESLFRISIASDLLMLVSDVALALVLFVLLRTVNHSLSLLAAFFRLIQAAILGVNLLNLFFVLQLLRGADYVAALGTEQVYAQALFFLDAHSIGYSIGLVFFGIDCLVVGYLLFKSGYLPKILAILLIFTGFGYLVDSFASFLLPTYENYETIFGLVVFLLAIIGEVSLSLWLLLKGVAVQPTEVQHSTALSFGT